LASRLIGWDLDIRTREEIVQEKEEAKKAKAGMMLDGIGGKALDALMEAGFDTLEKIKDATVEQLTQVKGVGAKKAEKIILAAETTGKLKMAAQVVAILFLIVDGALATTFDFYLWGTGILLMSLALSVLSAVQYCRQFVILVLPRLGNQS
jgi:hypothetical protein